MKLVVALYYLLVNSFFVDYAIKLLLTSEGDCTTNTSNNRKDYAMVSAAKLAKQERHRQIVAKCKAERALKPKIKREWVVLRGMPVHPMSDDAMMALGYLLENADRVEMMEFPKDQSQYKAYLDDGVFQGCFEFKFTENGMNPYSVLLALKATGWPGYNMGWIKDAARNQMRREMSRTA